MVVRALPGSILRLAEFVCSFLRVLRFSPLLQFGIERFHSRDQRPCWTAETKESICIKKLSSIPGGFVWYTIMAAISLFWNTNMAAVTPHENLICFLYSVPN